MVGGCAEFQKVKLWNSEIFNKKCLGQLKHCLDILNQNNVDKIDPNCFECVCYCLEQTVYYPDLSRDVALNIIGNLVPVILGLLHGEDAPEALRCLQSCMKYFRGSCNAFKNDIKLSLIALIDSKHISIIKNVGICLGALVELGSGGESGNNYSSNFFDVLNLLLSGMDRCVSVLLNTEESFFKMLKSSSSSDLDILPSLQKYDFRNKVGVCQIRYANLANCLSIILRYPFQYCTPIPLREILSVIYEITELATSKRCPAVSGMVGEDVSTLIISPLIDLLASLVVSCETNVLYYDASVHKLILFLLKSNEITNSSNVDPALCILRGKCYGLLTVWLKKFQGKASSDHASSILGQIMNDIDTFGSKSMELDKLSSKKASKTILKMAQSNEVLSEVIKCPPAKVKLCCEALVLLDTLLVCTGPLLQLHSVKKVSDKLLQIASKLHHCNQIPFPYTDRQSRVLLYTALSSLLLLSHPSLPIPLHLVISLISEGRNDPDFEVSYYCHKSLSVAMLAVHPFYPVRSTHAHYNKLSEADGSLENSGHSDIDVYESRMGSFCVEGHVEPTNENGISDNQMGTDGINLESQSNDVNDRCQHINNSEENQGPLECSESNRESRIPEDFSITKILVNDVKLSACETNHDELDSQITVHSQSADTVPMETSESVPAKSVPAEYSITNEGESEGSASSDAVTSNDLSVQDMLSCFVDEPPDDS